MWMRLTRTFVTSSGKQQKRPSHVVIETTKICVGMRNVNPSTGLHNVPAVPQGDNSSLAATAILAKFDRKQRDRWSEGV